MNQPVELRKTNRGGMLLRSVAARIGEFKYLYSLLRITRSGLRKQPDFPALVELQTVNRCNASCPMCPYPDTIAKQQLSYLSDQNYEEILQQLLREPEFQMLVLTFQNEPLLDKQLVNRARRFKELMPDKHLEIVTNGVLLTPDRVEQLYQWFDLISISINAHSPETHASVMGMNNFQSLKEKLEFIATNPKWVDKTVLRFIRQEKNSHERRDFGRYWRKHGFRVFSFEINSRLDKVNNYHKVRTLRTRFGRSLLLLFKPLAHLLLPHCTIPDLTSYIRANGDVVLCFNDYSEDNLLGSINDSSIREIFNADHTVAIRKRVRCNQVEDGEICKKCDLYKEGIWLTF